MYALFATLIIICSILLVLIILIQNPKGGGLSSSFGGGASQMMGVKKTTDFLDKSTWILATILIALILASNLAIDSGSRVQDSKALDPDNIQQVDPVETPVIDETGTKASDSTK